MRVAVIGLNHKLADLKLREKVAKACHLLFGTECPLLANPELVLLSTCNRTEIYFSSDDLPAAHTYILSCLRHLIGEAEENFDQKLYSYFGLDCFHHLARVTSGLDSAIIGETEIQGQVKTAYEKTTAHRQLPHELHYIFQKSLKIGKQVRSELKMGRGFPDLEHGLMNIATDLFAELPATKVLFVGASEINRKILSFLKSKKIHDLTLCNRTLEKSKSLIETYDLKTLTWDHLEEWHHFDWIIFGTKSPNYLITKEELPKGNAAAKLIIDLCVPRNVDPSLGKCNQVSLYNIDQINHSMKSRKKEISSVVQQAETLIFKATETHLRAYFHKQRQKHFSLTEIA